LDSQEATLSTDISIKPAGALATSIFVTPPNSSVRDAVPTELAASKAVTAVERASAVSTEPQSLPGTLSHQITIDRAAAAIVYQTIDERTLEVVRQFPDDAMLRRRAYFRSLDLQKPDPGQTMPTDRKA
jgi:hypothetical protein